MVLLVLIPVILFSSIFLLVAYVPNAFNFYWSSNVEATLMRVYSASMGILGFLMAATIAKSLTDNFNGQLPKTNQINSISVMVASLIAFILVGVEFVDGGFSFSHMGTKGLLTAFIVGFTVPNIYKFCVKNNITIKMPDEVPPNISQTFKDLIPITLTVVFFWLFDLAFVYLFEKNLSITLIEVFQPIFSAADGYMGLALIFGAMAFFWFVGIHGPSIVEPAIAAIYIMNVETNLLSYQSGEQATKILSQGSQYFIATLGGTGATLVITFMFAFLAKSKQMKTIGRASAIPVIFGVNEPILFGAPFVLNPVFFIPFVLTPIANIWLFKFFVDNMGMNGFIYNLPWTTPGPVGLIIGTGFALMSMILMLIILIVDFLIYYPFFKVYDKQSLEKEKALGEEKEDTKEISQEEIFVISEKKEESQESEFTPPVGKKRILVLCANGATSGMLANAIKKGAVEKNVDLESIAMAYGQHKDIINTFDLIILAPQMSSMLKELILDTEGTKTKASSTSGAEYVALARDPSKALDFTFKCLEEKENK